MVSVWGFVPSRDHKVPGSCLSQESDCCANRRTWVPSLAPTEKLVHTFNSRSEETEAGEFLLYFLSYRLIQRPFLKYYGGKWLTKTPNIDLGVSRACAHTFTCIPINISTHTYNHVNIRKIRVCLFLLLFSFRLFFLKYILM